MRGRGPEVLAWAKFHQIGIGNALVLTEAINSWMVNSEAPQNGLRAPEGDFVGVRWWEMDFATVITWLRAWNAVPDQAQHRQLSAQVNP